MIRRIAVPYLPDSPAESGSVALAAGGLDAASGGEGNPHVSRVAPAPLEGRTMSRHIAAFTVAVFCTAWLTAAGFPGALLFEARSVPGSTDGGPPQECVGVRKTADRAWLVYDGNPKPFLLVPGVLTDVHVIAAIAPEQDFTICRRVDRSTWTRRAAWLQVYVPRDHSDPPEPRGPVLGWITMPRHQADLWVSEP